MSMWCRIRGAQRFQSAISRARWLCATHRTPPESRRYGGLGELFGGPPIVGRAFAQSSPARFFAAPASSRQAREKAMEKKESGPRTNEEIDAEYVRLVTDEGHEVVSRKEALDRARKLDLDLVEVSREADPPVCKIMDFHKEKFRKLAEVKELAKTKAETSVRKGDYKEVKFTGKIEKKDLDMKAETVKRLMERGYRVKVVAEAGKQTGSLDADKEDLGKVLSRLYKLIEDDSALESPPLVKERMAYLIVRHAKFGTKKNPPRKSCKEDEAEANGTQAQHGKLHPSMDTSKQVNRVAETFMPGPQTGFSHGTQPNIHASSSPGMDNSKPRLGPTGISIASGITKVKPDSTVEHRDSHAPPAPSYASPGPQPDPSNRYAKSVPNRYHATRNPAQPSFVKIRDEGLLDLRHGNSHQGNGSPAGKVSFQPSPHRQQNRAEQPRPGPKSPGILSAQERCKPTPVDTNQSSWKSTSDEGSHPKPKDEIKQKEWGIFSR